MTLTYFPRSRSGTLATPGALAPLPYTLPEKQEDDDALTTVCEVIEIIVWSTATLTYSQDGGATTSQWPPNMPMPLSQRIAKDADFQNFQVNSSADIYWRLNGTAHNNS